MRNGLVTVIIMTIASTLTAGEWNRYDVEIQEIAATASNNTSLILVGGNATLDPGACQDFILSSSLSDALKSMLSVALTAKSTGSKIKVQFNDDGGCLLGRYKI